MDDIGTYLIVGYNIKRVREQRAIFESRLEDRGSTASR